MATKLVFRNLNTYPRAIPQNGYKDMLVADSFVAGTSVSTDSTTPVERSFLLSGVPMRFWSERVASQVTISGEVSFSLRASASVGFTGRLRAYLSKITVGGSNVESPIGQADALADLTSTSVSYVFVFTPATAVTIAPNERFICRVTVLPVAGSFGTGSATLSYNGGGGTAWSSMTFTETMTFTANGVMLFLQPTSSGIGNFYDMTQTLAGVGTTGVVNTTAGGTKIQWTRTAGGTVLEWISARLKAPGWTVDSIALFGNGIIMAPPGPGVTAPVIWASESNAAANATVCLEVFRRTPDGTELLVATWTYTLLEFQAVNASQILATSPNRATAVLAQITNFAEDDRLVARAYCIPFTGLTMGGGFTCTLYYNGQTPGLAYSSFLSILDSPGFKASGDPDKVEGPVPDGLPMSGVGN